MTKIRVLVAAAVLSMTGSAPVFAHSAVLQSPGTFSFYYPDNDVLNDGAPTPASGGAFAQTLRDGRGTRPTTRRVPNSARP